jgi:methionyl-tRNA synthetase
MTIDEFKKVELRVGKIIEAERVEGSDKLIKMKVDLGEKSSEESEEKKFRQILAGIGKNHDPDNLVGMYVVVVANLEPRMLMGMESQGMLLAAHGELGEAILLTPEKETPLGSQIS